MAFSVPEPLETMWLRGGSEGGKAPEDASPVRVARARSAGPAAGPLQLHAGGEFASYTLIDVSKSSCGWGGNIFVSRCINIVKKIVILGTKW